MQLLMFYAPARINSKELYAAMDGRATEKSGGSAANTMAGIASFGGKGAYIGLVANDALGHIFTNDIADIGVKFETAPYIKGLETARSFIFITPDGERSMNTFLGACIYLIKPLQRKPISWHQKSRMKTIKRLP